MAKKAIADVALLRRRIAVAKRIMHTVERELDAIKRLLTSLVPSDDVESLPDEVDDDDVVPYDIDELRTELARRLHALVDGRTGTQERPVTFRPLRR